MTVLEKLVDGLFAVLDHWLDLVVGIVGLCFIVGMVALMVTVAAWWVLP